MIRVLCLLLISVVSFNLQTVNAFSQQKLEYDSADHKAILEIVKNVQEALNERNVDRLLSYFSDNAQIMTPNQTMISKTEWKRRLPMIMKRFDKIGWKTKALEVKKFEIANDDAKIHFVQKITTTKETNLLLRKLDLKKSSNKWEILSSKYEEI
jgi:hypothetical protein